MRQGTVRNRRVIVAMAAAAATLVALPNVAIAENFCVSCHAELEDEQQAPVAAMERDIHSRFGVSCADCHGGDPGSDDVDVAMDPEAGFLGAPARNDIPEFCGRCHHDAEYIRQFKPGARVDQLELYWTSVHGHRLKAGDEKVATCVDCHHAHGVLTASDARSPIYAVNVPATCGRCHSDADYMAEYGIPTDQQAKFQDSVHGRLLHEKGGRVAPACNDCHGNHGAAPPGVSSVTNVCGQCHPLNADLLSRSPHAEPFAEMDVAACESCHGHHDIARPTDERLGSGPNSACTTCHDPDSKGYLTAVAMKAELAELRRRQHVARDLLEHSERAGMEVRDAMFQLHEVDNTVTKARTAVHAFSLSHLQKVTAVGVALADSTIVLGNMALAELQYRRKGLGVSLIVIVIVGLALFQKIREVDGKRGHR